MMHPSRPRIAAALAVVVVLALLAGCAPERTPGWKPAAWPTTGGIVAASTIAGPAPKAVDTVPQRLRSTSAGVAARWSYLPGAQPVNDRIAALVRAAVDAQARTAGVVYRPTAAPAGAGLGDRGCVAGAVDRPAAALLAGAGLAAAPRVRTTVVCDIVRAAGPIFGERLRVVSGTTTTVTRDVTTVVYADTSSGRAGVGRDLFADPAVVWTAVVDTLRHAAGSLSLDPVGAPTAAQLAAFLPALDAAVVDGTRIVVPLPIGFAAHPLDGLQGVPASTPAATVHVAVDLAAIRGALSDLGRTVADAHGDYAGPRDRGPGFDRVDCDLTPCMALTLDDGPSRYTAGILDILRAQQAAVTFFMLGQNAQRHQSIVRRVAAEGHEIGDHTWDHPYLTTLTDAQIRSQLGRTAQLLRALSGQPVAIFRPPGGFIDQRVLKDAGEPAILWSVDTRDWAGPTDEHLLSYAVKTPKAGSIMLMHDIQPVTARVFARVVAGLRDRGFSLVTVQKLFDGKIPQGIVRQRP